jgi:hypothetical protein
MVVRRPISIEMSQRAAKALWDQHRELEGRVIWEDAASWARDPYEQKARLVLETALPQNADFLRLFAEECKKVADIL